MKVTLFQGMLAGVFILAGLIGLFVFATHSSTSTSKQSTFGSVAVWGTLPSSEMQAFLTAATQIDPSFKDITYIEKNEATLPNELASAIATGNAPDLVLASQEDLHSLSKLVSPIPTKTLPASTFTSSFVSEANLFTAPGGAGYYGMPFLVDPLVLYSNHALLSSNGIAKPPSTWEALIGLVPNIAQLTPSRTITRGLIALGTYDNVQNARAILSSLLLQAGVPISGYSNGPLVADLGGTATTPNGTPPGSAAISFYTQFADPSKVSYTWNTAMIDARQAFLAGDLALYLGYASEARFLKQANPNLDFLASELPQPGTASVKRAYGLLYAFMIPRGAKNPTGAYQAAGLMTNTPEQTAAATAFGLAPASVNALTTPPADPTEVVAAKEALYATGWLSPQPSDVDRVFSGMISSVISGRLSVSEALTAAETALTPLLQ